MHFKNTELAIADHRKRIAILMKMATNKSRRSNLFPIKNSSIGVKYKYSVVL